MSNDKHANTNGGNDNLSAVEAQIRNAADFLRPSAGLRSRILINANQTTEQRRLDKRLSLRIMLVAACLLTVTCFARLHYSKWISLVGDNADYAIHQRSELLRQQQSMPLETSFAEAFQQIRSDVSKKFATSHTSSN